MKNSFSLAKLFLLSPRQAARVSEKSETFPAAIKIAALLDKPERRLRPITAAYCGFPIPDEFVVGYGLDYAEKYRSLKDICILEEED